MTPAEVLDAAADLIERDGWFGGPSAPDNLGANCAFTACVAVDKDVCWPALYALADYLGHDGITRWNDAQDGPDKVVWTMRQVAADLREGDG